ncbi:peptidoglycan-binding domain-containing protein [Micromonospora sp. NBC_01796]|uniref:peptidoglycan-binding domain-containing protein n=1 Tax=Micromonospora sp. NBC_01796 TaxID=2975987 RepID=UPI002DD97677|nr:peptidoglycan-binding domain-containing protein [Micromonospora sp. NBC_01796]WSA83246.1 peptidoglycan-binding protein [Micromonospora sp. NBC_01796]
MLRNVRSHRPERGAITVVSALLLLLATAVLAVVLPGTAQAATPVCNNLTYISAPSQPPSDMHVPTYGAQTGNKECHLSRGHQGLAVKVLQEALNSCYSRGLLLDGKYGQNTYNAVLWVQRDINATWEWANIAEDGGYGPQTRAWMGFAIFGKNGGPMMQGCYFPG